MGEYAHARLDLPRSLRGTLFAQRQQGFYAQAGVDFLQGIFEALPESFFAGVVRLDWVDFDTELDGDAQTRLTLGANFRPTPDSVFKFNYDYNWLRDRFDVDARSAGIKFSVATYF